jgi:molecular chaperone HtpG
VADSIGAARSSPHLGIFRRKGVEVLLLGDRVDEWLVGQLNEFEGKRLQDVTRGDLELGALFSEADRKVKESDLKESKTLLRRVKDALGERVGEVRVSGRLTDSPACLVLGEHDLSHSMRRILESAGQKAPASKPVLELNVQHPLVKYLDGLADAERFKELALLLFDQSALADGVQLEDPADYVRRLNRLLVSLGAGANPSSGN